MQPTQKTVTGVELTPADLLRLAACYLRRHGWTKGDYYARPADTDPTTGNGTPNPTPSACALGAIAMATYGTPVTDPFGGHIDADVYRYTTEVLRDHLILHVFGPPEHPEEERTIVPDWNDDYVVNVIEVIETLEAAAREWDFYHGAQTACDTATEQTSGGAE